MTRPTWDISQFAAPQSPTSIGKLYNLEGFATPNSIRVLDMPIYMPRQGWRLPIFLKQFKELLGVVLMDLHPAIFDEASDYVYITVDQKPVQPKLTQRRPGFHSDGFIVDNRGRQLDVVPHNQQHLPDAGQVDYTYIAYDALPTLFAPGPFTLTSAADTEAAASFDWQSASQALETYPPGSVLRLTPYVVHASAPNHAKGEVDRTFVKITVSEHQFNRLGNTHNHLFDYKWNMIPRDNNRREHRHVQDVQDVQP